MQEQNMSSQVFRKMDVDHLERVVSVEEYLHQKIIARKSFFQPIPMYTKLRLKVAIFFVRLFEYMWGVQLKVENPFGELFTIDSRARRTIHELQRDNIARMFWQGVIIADRPHITEYTIQLTNALDRSDILLAGGAGKTLEDAMRASLGEVFERHSLTAWNESLFVKGSFVDLKKYGAISPNNLCSIKTKNKTNLHPERQEINWVHSNASSDGKKHLVPAQAVYLFFRRAYPKEPALLPITSNAAAAGQSFNDALRRALLEGIERDSFLVYWMNKCIPDRIRLDSIENESIRSLLNEIEQNRFEVTILNIATDLQVPTVCSVIIDRFGGRAVSVALDSGFDIEKAILKTLRDAVRHGISNTDRIEKSSICDEKNYTNILGIKDRGRLWTHQCMIPRIQFFLSGKEKDLQSIIENSPQVSQSGELLYLKKILRDKGYRWYAIDVTVPAARREKIRVVKAVLPDLIPMFFSEQMRPVGVSRMYTAPVSMGLCKTVLSESELNPLPHPFL